MGARKNQGTRTSRQDPYERARAAFAVAHMSNAKWRKVLHALACADLGLSRSEWKFIDSEGILVHGMPRECDILENRFADGPFQPIEYKWIEWVRFPRKFKPYRGEDYEVVQDVASLKRILEGCGQLQLQLDDGGLTLFAYGR